MPGPKVAPADFRRSNYANLIWAKWRILADALTAVRPHVKNPSVRMQNVQLGCSKSSYRSHNGKPHNRLRSLHSFANHCVACCMHTDMHPARTIRRLLRCGLMRMSSCSGTRGH